MKKTMAVAAALSLYAGAATAGAVDVPTQDMPDLQCMALVAYVASTAEEGSEMQSGMVGGMMYYLGRLEGRSPQVDWLARLADYVESIDEATLLAESSRCGKEMTEKGQALVAFGDKWKAEHGE